MLFRSADDRVDRLRGKINSRGEPKLSAQAIQWPTPAAQNWKGSSPASVIRADGKSRMDILHYRAEQGFTRPDPAIMPLGLRPSHHAPISRPLWASMIASHGRVVSRRVLKARARRRLNPLFRHHVMATAIGGWLMGWPIGHARGTLGNGVHPLAAAHAWRSLSTAHGLGPVDLAPGGGAGQPGADEPL